MTPGTGELVDAKALSRADRLSRLKAYLDGLSDRPVIAELVAELKRAELTIEDVRPWVRFDSSGYQRNLMWEGPMYEALILCWKVGQHSPIHDHAGSICGVHVLQGRATETIYEMMPCGVVAPVRSGSKVVGECCGSVDDDTHMISNYEADTDLVTLHIYAPKLGQIGIFDHEGVKHEEKLVRFEGFVGGAGI